MKREIQFKAKTVEGIWVYGDLLTKDVHHGHAICENGCIIHSILPDTICQYVLTLPNGDKLWEGDKFTAFGGSIVFTCTWHNGCFGYWYAEQFIGIGTHNHYDKLINSIQIVGNIHD